MNIIDEIKKLKKEKNALILAHLYQRQEIQEIADIVGDSYFLSKKAVESDSNLIVFCGVGFMAESAKILSPNKKVLLPAKEARCPMADMALVDKLNDMKKEHPNAKVISYINTNLDIKYYIIPDEINLVFAILIFITNIFSYTIMIIL